MNNELYALIINVYGPVFNGVWCPWGQFNGVCTVRGRCILRASPYNSLVSLCNTVPYNPSCTTRVNIRICYQHGVVSPEVRFRIVQSVFLCELSLCHNYCYNTLIVPLIHTCQPSLIFTHVHFYLQRKWALHDKYATSSISNYIFRHLYFLVQLYCIPIRLCGADIY